MLWFNPSQNSFTVKDINPTPAKTSTSVLCFILQDLIFVTPTMILSVWDPLFFHLLQHRFSYSQNTSIFSIPSMFSLLTCSGFLWNEEKLDMLENCSCSRRPYRLRTQSWQFLLYVSYIPQISSIPKHTCGVCQCYWNLLWSTQSWLLVTAIFPIGAKLCELIWLDIFFPH